MSRLMPVEAAAVRMHGWARAWLRAALAAGVVLAVAVAALSGLFGPAGLPEGSPGLLLFGAFGSLFGGVGVLVGVIFYFSTRSTARTIESAASAQTVLAHWTYTRAEWERFTQGELEGARKFVRVAAPVLTGLAGAAVAAYQLEAIGEVGLVIACVAWGSLALVGLLVWLSIYLPARRLHRAGAGDVYLSRDGVLMAGTFHSWRLFGGRLTGAEFREGPPPVVEFRWMQPGAGHRGSTGPVSVSVPVPAGREAEARALVASLGPPQ